MKKRTAELSDKALAELNALKLGDIPTLRNKEVCDALVAKGVAVYIEGVAYVNNRGLKLLRNRKAA